jgi:hypothetical protein
MVGTLRRALWICGGVATLATVVVLMASRPAHAQMGNGKRPDGPGVAHLEAKVGSFKLLAADPDPPKGYKPDFLTGHLEMSCSGTFLITGADHPPVITGNIIKEYEYAPLKKVAYHGTGKLVMDGTWTSLQWFGTDLTATFKGRGKFRLVGEFDKNQQLGTYWTVDPKSRQWWSANSAYDHYVPGYVGTHDDSNWHGTMVPLGTQVK